jgi:hypothetical protein
MRRVVQEGRSPSKARQANAAFSRDVSAMRNQATEMNRATLTALGQIRGLSEGRWAGALAITSPLRCVKERPKRHINFIQDYRARLRRYAAENREELMMENLRENLIVFRSNLGYVLCRFFYNCSATTMVFAPERRTPRRFLLHHEFFIRLGSPSSLHTPPEQTPPRLVAFL